MSSEVYKNKSIIDINIDDFTVNTGTVTRTNVLKLMANSRCTFSYNFANDPLATTKLKCEYDIFGSNSQLDTRYNDKIKITLKISYYNEENNRNETTYVDGKTSNVQIIPYLNNESMGAYEYEEINCESNYIKSIDVIIAYYDSGSDNYVNINKLSIFPTMFASENSTKDEINNSIEDYMDSHPQELVIPLLDSIPDINSVPDGYIFRLSSEEARD